MLMSLVSSAKRHDLDVWKYVKDVLDQRLAGETDDHKLLPDVWKQTHPEAVRVHRVEERRDKADRSNTTGPNDYSPRRKSGTRPPSRFATEFPLVDVSAYEQSTTFRTPH